MRNKRWIGVTALAVITAAAMCASIVIKKNLTGNETVTEVALTENGSALNIEKAEEITDGKGEVTGHIITVRGYGFDAGGFLLAVRLDADKTKITGIEVLECAETDGFGAKMTEDDFLAQFEGLTGTVAMADVTGENEVNAISGATLTSNGFAEAVNKVLAYVNGEEGSAAEETALGVSNVETLEDGSFVVTVSAKGFSSDPVVLSVSIDAARKNVTGLNVVSQNETQGLGANVTSEEFLSQFDSLSLPVSLGEGSVDAISGATVTSNAVITAINEAYDYLTALVD